MSQSKSNKNKLIPIPQAVAAAVMTERLSVEYTREHDGSWGTADRILCFGLWKHQTPLTLTSSFEYFRDLLCLPFHQDDLTMLAAQHEYMRSEGLIMNERVLVSIRLSEETLFAVAGTGYPSPIALSNQMELAHPMLTIIGPFDHERPIRTPPDPRPNFKSAYLFCPTPSWASNRAISSAARICLIRGTPVRFNNEVGMTEVMQGLASHVLGALKTALITKFQPIFGRTDIGMDMVLIPYRIPILHSKEEELAFYLLLRKNRDHRCDNEVVTADYEALVDLCTSTMGLQTAKSAIINVGFMDLEVVTSEFDIQENPYLNTLLTNFNQVTIITMLRQGTMWEDIDTLFYSKNQVVIPFIRFIVILRGDFPSQLSTMKHIGTSYYIVNQS